MSSIRFYEDLIDRLDDARSEIYTEVLELNEIYEAKPTEDLASRIYWLNDAQGDITEAIDSLYSVIGVC